MGKKKKINLKYLDGRQNKKVEIIDKIKRVYRGITHQITSEDYIRWLSKKGISIGENCYFFSPNTVNVDTQRPWLLKIGDYCKITQGVIILTHDYSRSVLRRVYGDVVGGARQTIIGDNVFLGMNTIVLMGANIGDNVIIGAGSVVSGTIPSNVVAAGVPAKVICSLSEYYKKRKSKMKGEAIQSAILYRNKYGHYPTEMVMGEFFPLYAERSKDYLNQRHISTAYSGDNEKEIIEAFLNTTPEYLSYDAFLEDVEAAEITEQK